MKQNMNGWNALLSAEYEKPYYKNLKAFLHEAYSTTTVFPKKEDLFTAYQLTSYDDVRIVFLGQDPYHGDNQAHGLSFSIASKEAKFAPSLRNIFKEMESDIGIKRTEPNLSDWAKQGILMLNTVLTVQRGVAGSHRKKGWEEFTTATIEAINQKETPVIFVLWGRDAQSKIPLITNPIHHIIKSVHPSPLSANGGFFGSKPFSQINTLLSEMGDKNPVIWG